MLRSPLACNGDDGGGGREGNGENSARGKQHTNRGNLTFECIRCHVRSSLVRNRAYVPTVPRHSSRSYHHPPNFPVQFLVSVVTISWAISSWQRVTAVPFARAGSIFRHRCCEWCARSFANLWWLSAFVSVYPGGSISRLYHRLRESGQAGARWQLDTSTNPLGLRKMHDYRGAESWPDF